MMRAWWPATLLGIGCLLNLSIESQRTMDLQAPLATLSKDLHGHSSAEIPVDSGQAKVAGATTYLNRAYSIDTTSSFGVYVGYYDRQRQGKTIHSPKNCLPGGGWEPLESRRDRIADASGAMVNVNRFVIANKQNRAIVYYWYQGRGRTQSNEYLVKLDLIRDAALHRRSEEALVRVVVPVLTDETTADALARRIVGTLHGELTRILPT